MNSTIKKACRVVNDTFVIGCGVCLVRRRVVVGSDMGRNLCSAWRDRFALVNYQFHRYRHGDHGDHGGMALFNRCVSRRRYPFTTTQ